MGTLQNYANSAAVEQALNEGRNAYAGLNGHTVGTDVPENAVFTDTVYDDTELMNIAEQNKTDILYVEKQIENLSDDIFTSIDDIATDISNINGVVKLSEYSAMINATNGYISLSSDTGYDTYYFVADKNMELYTQGEPASYYAICVGENYTGIVTNPDTGKTYLDSKNGVRYRNSENTLPTIDNKLSISAGDVIAFTVVKGTTKIIYGIPIQTVNDDFKNQVIGDLPQSVLKNQGVSNAGKILGVGTDGLVCPIDIESAIEETIVIESPVSKNWEGWTVLANTSVDSKPKLVSGDTYKQYTTYTYEFTNQSQVYFENETANYICLGVFPLGITDGTDTSATRYRLSDNNLPTKDNPVTVDAGTVIAVTNDYGKFNTYGLTEPQLIVKPKDGQIAVQLTNSGTTQTITIYHAVNGSYCIGQKFERVPNTEKNSDVWHLNRTSIYNANDFSLANSNPTTSNYFDGQIVNNGEWENAIQETGMSDFMGGTLHGDEKYKTALFFLDGKPLDISDDFFLCGKELKVIEITELYRESDHTTKVVDRSCIWTFKDGEITVMQTHKFAVDVSLSPSYTMMFPINKKYSENFLVDGNPSVLNFPKETENSYKPTDTVGVKEQSVTVWGNDVVCDISIECNQQGTWFMNDNGNDYNKLYWEIGNRSYSVDEVIKTKTVYHMRVGDYKTT